MQWPFDAHEDEVIQKSREGKIPSLHYLVFYGQLREQPKRAMSATAELATIAMNWLGLKKVSRLYLSGSRDDDGLDRSFSKRNVDLLDPEIVKQLVHLDDRPFSCIIESPRRGSGGSSVDFDLTAVCKAGEPRPQDEGESGVWRPLFEVSVRVDFHTRTSAEMHALAMQLVERACSEFEIAHGCVEFVFGPHVSWAGPYAQAIAKSELDRVVDGARWGQVDDPTKLVYRVGYMTLLHESFVEAMDRQLQEDTVAWYNAYRPWAVSNNYVMDAANRVKVFCAGDMPGEYLDNHLGLPRPNEPGPVLLAVAALKSRLRKCNLIL